MKAIKQFPKFEIDWVSEISRYTLREETPSDVGSKDIEESTISFTTQNDMMEDKPVFSIILFSTIPWDQYIRANDLIRIRVMEDTKRGTPENPYIMVGMVSDVTREADYEDGSIMYRITGEGMSKVLTNMHIGTIQEVASLIPENIGWLPDDTEEGIAFSGKSAADIIQQVLDKFMFEYAQYNFHNDRSLDYYITTSVKSWEDEQLSDVTPFINYEGSLHQFIQDASAKPFNEWYSEFTKNGRDNFILRRTPFDYEDWFQLPKIRVDSELVIEESISMSDSEMYGVFIVSPQNLFDLNSVELGVYPKYHPSLLEKYGYKRLDVDNRYLMTTSLAVNEDEDEEQDPDANPDYPALGVVQNFFYNIVPDDNTEGEDGGQIAPEEYVRNNRNDVENQLRDQFNGVDKGLAESIVEYYLDEEEELDSETYYDLLEEAGASEDQITEARESSYATDVLNAFSERLFNWNGDNANYRSGDIRVLGSPSYRLGMRFIYDNYLEGERYEYYIESVGHEFSFTNGFVSTVGVTRGLPDYGNLRFDGLYGQSQDFKGGYFGEPSIAETLAEAESQQPGQTDQAADIGAGSGQVGGDVAMAAVENALSKLDLNNSYRLGGGRGSNPFNENPTVTDCSSFLWWVFKEVGKNIGGTESGMDTRSIRSSSSLTTISSRGTDKNEAVAKLRVGDIIFFDTNRDDGHAGMYLGEMEFQDEDQSDSHLQRAWIGSQSSTGIDIEPLISSAYWWKAFNGHIRRAK